MPGYEPFLLCDFHVHTTWSDGRLSVREVVDLYGQTGHFDVIAITDHILMKKDLLARAGADGHARAARLLGHRAAVRRLPRRDRRRGAGGRRKLYDLLVIPGAEITQNHIRSKKNSHIIALDLTRVHQRRPAGRGHPAGDPAAGRAEHRLPPASPDDAAHRDQHLLSVGPPQAAGGARRRLGGGQPRRPVLGDQPQALSLRRQQRLPQAEAPLLVEDAAQVREELAGDRARAAAERRRRADALPQRLVGGLTGPRYSDTAWRSVGAEPARSCRGPATDPTVQPHPDFVIPHPGRPDRAGRALGYARHRSSGGTRRRRCSRIRGSGCKTYPLDTAAA